MQIYCGDMGKFSTIFYIKKGSLRTPIFEEFVRNLFGPRTVIMTALNPFHYWPFALEKKDKRLWSLHFCICYWQSRHRTYLHREILSLGVSVLQHRRGSSIDRAQSHRHHHQQQKHSSIRSCRTYFDFASFLSSILSKWIKLKIQWVFWIRGTFSYLKPRICYFSK